MKIGITGAAGNIGETLRSGLEDHDLFLYDIKPINTNGQSWEVDLAERENCEGIFDGLDALIHLAADPNPNSLWKSLYPNNLSATYNVLDEAGRAGVKRFVFASSNHVQHGRSKRTTPETLDVNFVREHGLMKVSDLPKPDSLYGVSKLYGEILGGRALDTYGLQFVALRIGWTISEDDPTIMKGKKEEDYMRAMFLSKRDCVQAFRKALANDVDYFVGYAISNNDRRVFDLTETEKVLGYKPEDNAENYSWDGE